MSEPSEGQGDEMRIDPQRAATLASNLASVLRKIDSANTANRTVRLVAVSKLKPASDILSLTQQFPSPSAQPQASTRTKFALHFGESYPQELLHKASILPAEIKWIFLGALQSNKCAQLARQPNLWLVAGVDTRKKADQLEKGRKDLFPEGEEKKADRLRVFIQINTSAESQKSGLAPASAEVDELALHILRDTPHLRLSGLMTIGSLENSQASSDEENPDFKRLIEERDRLAKVLEAEAPAKEGGERDWELELSMGMSADYELAVKMGSDEVRVGSEIFGARPPRKKASES